MHHNYRTILAGCLGALVVFGPIQTPKHEELSAFATQFMESLQAAGSIRKVDPQLISPLLLKGPPCSLLTSVSMEVCGSLSQKDRLDYALAAINVMWLMYEYQLSQSTPAWLRDRVDRIQASDLFPPEVQDALQNLLGAAKTADAFKETYVGTKQVEALMRARYARMTDAEKRNVSRNGKIVEEAFRRNGVRSGEAVAVNEISNGALAYTKPPFVYFVARDQGKLKLIWFSFVTQ